MAARLLARELQRRLASPALWAAGVTTLYALSSSDEQLHTTQTEAPGHHQTRYLSNLRRHRTIQKLEEFAEQQETINDRYQVNWNHPLGEGAFGAVYVGVDRRSGEQVAVKKISKEFTDNKSFQREMDALLHIREEGGHPHICGLRENFEEGQYYYLVLDLISGGEMFDHLCEQGAYSEADAARLVREVARYG